jgi:ubiquinone/menaquinone biosynthesis C-methylase UbiE
MSRLWLLVVVVIAAAAYHALVIAEGTYLGSRLVAILYDRVASRYDRIKNLRYVHESCFLGIPLAERLQNVPAPTILDVATGTCRLPLAVLPLIATGAVVVGVDRSGGMLRMGAQARTALGSNVGLVQADAEALPMADASFDAVTCIEALEFFVRPGEALEEMRRVLRPGGVLLASNRVGWEALLLPRRVARRGALEAQLSRLGFCDVESRRWQVHYDLVWARLPDSGCSDDRRALWA